MIPTPSNCRAALGRFAGRLLLLGTAFLGACSSLPDATDPKLGEIERASAAGYLARAEADLAAGNLLRAALVLIELRQTRGLVPEQLFQADHLLHEAAEGLLSRMDAQEASSEELRQLYELGLPGRLRASAGLRMAARLFEEGHPVLSYRAVTDVEREVPNHPLRDRAAEILWRTGSYMMEKGGNYNLFFSYKVKGAAALEFLTEHYTTSPLGAQAYAKLARYYESIDDEDLALERWENLILFYGDHGLVPEAASRMPYLRMKRMGLDEYDRNELLRAKQEIERWLAYYPDLEQAPWMQENLAHCQERLAQNDLKVARFYRQINQPLGARLHGDRALIEARASGNERTIASVEALLASLPPEEGEAFGVEPATDGAAPAPSGAPGSR